MTHRSYVFTIHTDDVPESFPGPSIRGAVWQQERCPTTERLHLQGYVEFDRPCRIRQAKIALGYNDAHLEERKGSREQAIDYATKEDTRVAGPWKQGTVQ